MKICDVELTLAEIPRNDGRPPVRSLLVCLVTDSGREGWGEAPLRWRADELQDRQRYPAMQVPALHAERDDESA